MSQPGRSAETSATTPSAERKPKDDRPPLLRTREQIFQAGWDDGANDRPLSRDEITKLAALIRPYYRQHNAA